MAKEQKLSKAMDNEKPQVHIDAIRTGKDRLVDEREGWQSTKRARLGEGPCCFLVASSGILHLGIWQHTWPKRFTYA